MIEKIRKQRLTSIGPGQSDFSGPRSFGHSSLAAASQRNSTGQRFAGNGGGLAQFRRGRLAGGQDRRDGRVPLGFQRRDAIARPCV